MDKSYIIVFHGQVANGKITDIGDDPCFDSPPTWGICRPPTRKAIKVGTTLIFIAKIGEQYYLKGWFKIGDKIDYPTALQLYPNRQNVIICTTPAVRAIKWRYKKLKKLYASIHEQTTPGFLIQINTAGNTYYQRLTDEHEIDNWKCRRIFHCNTKQFENCARANQCLKSNIALSADEYRNYIVADNEHWEDLDVLQITWDEILTATKFPKKIRTPKGQHNVLRFDEYTPQLFEFIETKKRLAMYAQTASIVNHHQFPT